MKFKIGDKITIISNSRGANATIGEEGEITGFSSTSIQVKTCQCSWSLGGEDLKLIKEEDGNTTTPTIEETLAVRGGNYGAFAGHAKITQDIKRAMHAGKNWDNLSDEMKESLEMIAHKIGRILNGNPDYKDSWHDIIGYTKLIDDTLED